MQELSMPEAVYVAKVAVSAAIYSIDKPYDYIVPKDSIQIAQKGRRVMVPFGRGNKKTEGFILDIVIESERRPLKYLAHIFNDGIDISASDISLAMWMKKRYFCTFFEAANALLPPGVWNKSAEVFAPIDKPFEEVFAVCGASKQKEAVLKTIYTSKSRLTAAEIATQSGVDKAEAYLKKLISDNVITVSQQFSKKVSDKTIMLISLGVTVEQARTQIGNGKLAERRLSVIECIAQSGELPEKELCYLTGVTPNLVKRLADLGILNMEKAPVYRRPQIKKGDIAPEIVLNSEQQAAFDGLSGLLGAKPKPALLHGVTGSGKTPIYIKLIKLVREMGKNAILLVPEIALTPQMLRTFCLYFKDDVAVIHSALTQGERYDEYKRIKNGSAHVVIGTRTAIFAPLNNIGIIIIDEEQEYTYKSDAAPRYHAVDVAKYRCAKHGALLVLGSATPSVETYYNTVQKKYSLFTLEHRYMDTPLPSTVIADMRGTLKDGNISAISPQLMVEIQKNLESHEQSILFINRRGSSRMVACVDCGYIPKCENCSVSLTYHSKNGRLMCHHCGYSIPLIDICPDCGGSHIKLIGSGTQKVEEELTDAFPGIKVLRMDADTTVGRTSHEKILDNFASGKADILLGTQMVAKGLDFANVTLVGVIDADLSLYCGDYHAQERTFSLLAQVVGRAGRREKPGRAIIQSYTPKNPIIAASAMQDYKSFFEYEIETREVIEAPPFSDMFVFTLTGIDENNVLRGALLLSATLDKSLKSDFSDIQTNILGPVASPISRINKRFRYNLSFRGKDGPRPRALVSNALSAFYNSPFSRSVSISADMNPYSL